MARAAGCHARWQPMSQFFDDLARTLAQPMPRRRALRLAGGALVAVAVPGITATKAHATHDCPAQNAFLCACPNRDLFYKICCPNPTPAARYECRCKAPPNGYAQCYKLTNRCEQAGTAQCGSACCDDATETCVNPSRSLCCKKEDAGRACLGIGAPGSSEKGSGRHVLPRRAAQVLRRRQGRMLRAERRVLQVEMLPTRQGVQQEDRRVQVSQADDDLRTRVLHREGSVLERQVLPQGKGELRRHVLRPDRLLRREVLRRRHPLRGRDVLSSRAGLRERRQRRLLPAGHGPEARRLPLPLLPAG